MRYIGLTLLLCIFVAAAWPPDGVPVGGQAGDQLRPAAADDGAGGAWVVWRDDRSAATGPDIYARHVDKDGAALGPAAGIPVCTAPGAQTVPTVVPDGTGGCVVAWNDARNALTGLDVFAQRLDAAGHALWPPNGTGAMVTFGEQSAPRLMPDGFGAYDLIWQDARAGGFDIYAQRLDPDGLPLWDPVGVRVCAATGAQTRPGFVPDGSGGFIAAWLDRRGLDDDIYAQRLTINGARLWVPDGVPVCTAAGGQQPATGPPWLAGDNAGGAFLVWTDRRAPARPAATLQRLQPDGAPAAGWPLNGLAICAAPGGQTEPGVVADGAGGALLGWLDARSGAVTECYVGRRTSAGAVSAGWPAEGVTLSSRAGAKSQLRLAPDGGGGVRVAWVVSEAAGDDIDGQWISAQGARLGPASGLRLCAAAGGQGAPALAPLPDGDALLAWADQRSAATQGSDIYAHRFVGALGNLDAADPPAGFATTIVPSDAPNAGPGGVSVPAILPGNAPLTWFNAAFRLEGPCALPAWQTGLKLDGVPVGTGLFGEELPPGVVTQLNQGPFTVRGGRHTLSLDLDPTGVAGENDELDNSRSAQWVWSPQPLLQGEPHSRSAPPAAGGFTEPNADGFVFTPAPATAWVVATASRSDLSDVDLYLYDDYSGSGAGFSHRRAVSSQSASGTDFVVGLRDSAPRTLYPAVTRAGGVSVGAGFVIQAADARGRQVGQFPVAWPAQALPPDQLAQVYEVQLSAGESYDFRLLREQGTADLALALFGDAGMITPRTGAKASSSAIDDVSDRLTYGPTVSGWYALVVYRRFGAELEPANVYSLYAFAGVVGVPEGAVGDAPGPALRIPNPARGRVELALTLAAAGPLRVEIFDVRGRLVRRLLDRELQAAGPLALRWDGRDERGVEAPSGVFRARVTTAAGGLDRSFVRLR